MAKLNQRTLKLHLQQLSHEALLNEIAMLYDKFAPVKEYYQAKLSVDAGPQLLERYKDVIRREFFPSRGLPQARLSVARKAVADFKKINDSPTDLAGLMLCYVEAGVQFIREYGDIDGPFYNSMESMYERAVKHIVAHGIKAQFDDRCRRIVTDTSDTGWGFHDTLGEIFDEYFELPFEEE